MVAAIWESAIVAAAIRALTTAAMEKVTALPILRVIVTVPSFAIAAPVTEPSGKTPLMILTRTLERGSCVVPLRNKATMSFDSSSASVDSVLEITTSAICYWFQTSVLLSQVKSCIAQTSVFGIRSRPVKPAIRNGFRHSL